MLFDLYDLLAKCRIKDNYYCINFRDIITTDNEHFNIILKQFILETFYILSCLPIYSTAVVCLYVDIVKVATHRCRL